ncbi:ion channel [Vibrio coralliirubri]|uniref:potassium channel family protein n=1 Tax=Vibrio coralliirubri TaxID=1516159 RepID=UPI002284219F|nr:ion channel [Vibrio coralliirubri]MCY9861235.1 ion channel [Vibrio coralliirubri]
MSLLIRLVNAVSKYKKNPLASIKNRFILRSMAAQLEWKFSFTLYVIHFSISYALMVAANETTLVSSLVDFTYWYHITLSSVGYGDLSPKTDLGKLINVYWVVIFGIAIFSAFIGEIIQKYIKINDDLIKGKINLMKASKHIIIFGNTKHAARLIEQIRMDKAQRDREIALVLPDAGGFPELPKGTNIVAVSSFLKMAELQRLSIQDSLSILIDTGIDGESISLCLMVQQILDQMPSDADKPNVLAFFDEYEMEQIVESSCRDIECFSLGRNHVLATAITDVGTIKVNEAINCPTIGNATQFSKRLPECVPVNMTYAQLKSGLEVSLNITILGVEVKLEGGKRSAMLNPPRDMVLTPRQRFFYIASDRLDEELVISKFKNYFALIRSKK